MLGASPSPSIQEYDCITAVQLALAGVPLCNLTLFYYHQRSLHAFFFFFFAYSLAQSNLILLTDMRQVQPLVAINLSTTLIPGDRTLLPLPVWLPAITDSGVCIAPYYCGWVALCHPYIWNFSPFWNLNI